MIESFVFGVGSSFTANAQVLGPFDVSTWNLITIAYSGTYSGLTAVPEVSFDGLTWFPITVTRVDTSSTSTTTTPGTNGTVGYEIYLGSFNQFRLRTSAFTSGTCNVQFAAAKNGIDPIPNVQVSNNPGVAPSPQTGSGGVSTNHHLVSAATTNATSVKTTAASIGSVVLVNSSAAVKYVKFFNKASAPTVGTDIPVVTIAVPPTGTVIWEAANYPRLITGLAYCITGAVADLDTTAVAAGDVVVSIYYI